MSWTETEKAKKKERWKDDIYLNIASDSYF